MFFWKVQPRQFHDPASPVQNVRTIIAITMTPQNDSVGMGVPSDKVTFLLSFYDSDGFLYTGTRVFSKSTLIEDFTQSGQSEESAIELWNTLVIILLRGTDEQKYAVASQLAYEYGYVLLPISEQTGYIFEPPTPTSTTTTYMLGEENTTTTTTTVLTQNENTTTTTTINPE